MFENLFEQMHIIMRSNIIDVKFGLLTFSMIQDVAYLEQNCIKRTTPILAINTSYSTSSASEHFGAIIVLTFLIGKFPFFSTDSTKENELHYF